MPLTSIEIEDCTYLTVPPILLFTSRACLDLQHPSYFVFYSIDKTLQLVEAPKKFDLYLF